MHDGVTIEEVNADVARMLPIWMDSWTLRDGRSARSYEAWQIAPALRPLKADVVGDVGNVLWIVLAMIALPAQPPPKITAAQAASAALV